MGTCNPPEKQKPTVGLVTEVGYLRFDLSIPYRAMNPHGGALLKRQQMHAPILIQWLTGQFLSYIGIRESQFEGRLCALARRRLGARQKVVRCAWLHSGPDGGS